MNHITMGAYQLSDSYGRIERTVKPWERVWAFGWGCSLEDIGDSTRYLGVAVKPFASAPSSVMSENGEGIARSVAFDFGYLRLIGRGFRYGFNLANMGPSVFFIDKNNRNPIPLTANAAFAWKRDILAGDFDILRMAAELRMDKELVVDHYEGEPDPFYKAMFTDLFNEPFNHEVQEINIHTGCEVWVMNTGCFRQGILFDYLGERYELRFGTGINLFNHIRGDFAWIYAPDGFMKGLLVTINPEKDGATGVRHKQWQLSITIDAIGGWSAKDREWWKVNKDREEW